MTIGPEPRMRILWRSSRYAARTRLQEPVEQVEGVVRPRAGLGVVLDGRARDVEQLEALDRAVVEVDVGQLRRAEVGLPAHRLVGLDASAAVRRPHREAVVLRGDLDPAGAQVLDRVVGAAVAEGQLVGLQADRAAQQLVAEADARTPGACRRARARVARRSPSAAGSPGPLARKIASGSLAVSSAARRRARVQLDASRRAITRLRTIERLIPVSIAAMRGPSPAPCDARSHAGVTSRARSRPAIGGSAAIRSRASRLGVMRAGKTPPRIAPAVRMWRTSARVSTPVIAGTPASRSQSSQPCSAPGASSRSTAARMIAARAQDPVGLHRRPCETP